jgi:hypothetical protein
MKISGKIDGIEQKGDTVDIQFVRDDKPEYGECHVTLPAKGFVDSMFKDASKVVGAKLEFDTNDHERPSVISASINGKSVYKKDM